MNVRIPRLLLACASVLWPAVSEAQITSREPLAPAPSLQPGPAQNTSADTSFPPPAYARRTGVECADFQRRPDASWSAVQSVTFPGPNGPVVIDAGATFRPGQIAGGYDLGAMLQRACPAR
jgi:hypothetical protein